MQREQVVEQMNQVFMGNVVVQRRKWAREYDYTHKWQWKADHLEALYTMHSFEEKLSFQAVIFLVVFTFFSPKDLLIYKFTQFSYWFIHWTKSSYRNEKSLLLKIDTQWENPLKDLIIELWLLKICDNWLTGLD